MDLIEELPHRAQLAVAQRRLGPGAGGGRIDLTGEDHR